MRRVNEALREVLAAAIASEIKDPRIGFVTVTQVDTSPDLRTAKVFVSVMGDETDQEQTLEGLESANGFLQGRVASQMKLKRTPKLDFVHDDTIERAHRVNRLLEDSANG